MKEINISGNLKTIVLHCEIRATIKDCPYGLKVIEQLCCLDFLNQQPFSKFP